MKDITSRFTTTNRTASDVAIWFLQRNKIDRNEFNDVEGISNLKLQKLLYYAYGCQLALHQEKLFKETLSAWQHGPVVPSVYEQYKNNGSHSIETFADALIQFDTPIEEVLEWVYKEFGQYTAWALRNMTHEETPWLQTKINQIISDDLIYEYFREHYVEA